MTGGTGRTIEREALQRAFPGCDSAVLDATVARLRHRRLTAGEVLLQIDEPGQCAYLLLDGVLQVYGRGQNHQLVAIATLDTPGRLLGEQALLPGHRHRNAYVIALGDCRVAELPLVVFRQLLEADQAAAERLQRQALCELRQRLERLGVGLEDSLFMAAEAGSLQLELGARLLEAGRIPEQAFSLIAGQLSLRPATGGDPVLILGPGALVGVQELIRQQPCQLEAIADTALEVLPISAERLRRLPGSEEFTANLQALVALPGIGRVYRSRYVRDGERVVISDYSELPGGALRVLQIPGRRRIEATRHLSLERPTRSWLSPDGDNQLLVEPGSGRLLGLAMDQSWPQLCQLMGVLLRDVQLTDLQLQGFQANGQLLLEAPEARVEPGSQVVCACTETTGTGLREAARQCANLADLQRLTGAGTVCGGCLNRLPLFLNQPSDVRLCRVAVAPLAAGSVQVTLLPIEHQPLPPWQVGEHLLVEGLIDGYWVGRSYTLTGGDARHFELGIKREPGGVFSNWLAQRGPGDLVRISPPRGNLLPAPEDERPLLYLVAGIGVTPAIAACRRLRGQRTIHIAYCYRGEPTAAFLDELRRAAAAAEIHLLEHDSSRSGRLQPQCWLEALAPLLLQSSEVVVCGPEAFNRTWQALLAPLEALDVRLESFSESGNGRVKLQEPGAWRLSPEELALRRRAGEERFGVCPRPVPVGESCPLDEARSFLDSFRREVEPELDLEARLAEVAGELRQHGQWRLSHAELRHGTRLAWRQAERCVGRLYWQGLELFDRRSLQAADDIAEALFDHLRFAFNGGDLRPAISVFDPGEPDRPGPRLWNPQLLRYAGYRSASGRQIGDPAQNELTARLTELGWQPSGDGFELLPLVIQTAEEGPRLYPLPADCRQEVRIHHPSHPWLEDLRLRWYAVPAVSDMALDLGGNLFRLAPFNGWYLDTEIAARNFSDSNRFNLLPRIAEGLGLNLRDDRSLWRDHAQLVLAEAVLHSFDRAHVRISDHHGIGHEFLEFCRSEQSLGRDPQAEWSWVVPPMSGSLNVLYQEPFENRAFKPAYVPQPPIWQQQPAAAPGGDGSEPARCPFSG